LQRADTPRSKSDILFLSIEVLKSAVLRYAILPFLYMYRTFTPICVIPRRTIAFIATLAPVGKYLLQNSEALVTTINHVKQPHEEMEPDLEGDTGIELSFLHSKNSFEVEITNTFGAGDDRESVK
jgi:hypothetical protein